MMAHNWQTVTLHSATGEPIAVHRYMMPDDVIGTLGSGQTVQMRLGCTHWYQVLLADGAMGYVLRAEVTVTQPEAVSG